MIEKTQPKKPNQLVGNPLVPERVPHVYTGPLPFHAANQTFAPQKEDIRPFAPLQMDPTQKKQLLSFIKVRKIDFLTHFTRLENLVSILKHGILSRNILSREADFAFVRFNQPEMPAEWQGASCFNLSFPNYRLFYNLQERMGYDWAVILIDATILAEIPFYYFPLPVTEMVAIPNFSSKISPFLQGFDALQRLFIERIGDVTRNKLEIPPAYPTDPRSELLTFSPIPVKFIAEVHFFNDYKFKQWFLRHTDFALSLDKRLWREGLTYFSPRLDYNHWKSRKDEIERKNE